MEDKIMKMFLEEKQTPYEIHMKLDCSIKTVYHVIKQHEEQVRAHA